MSSRRHFTVYAGNVLVMPAALAQQPGRTYRLGWLGTSSPTDEPYNLAFMQRLADRGFVQGRNLVVEFRSMRGPSDRVPQIAAELAQLNCDVYFAPGSELTLAPIKGATRDKPISHAKVQAMVGLTSGFFVPARKQIAELALAHRLPSIFNKALWAEAGGLASYGPNFSASYRRTAEQVAQILLGANPGEMPLEQPNVVEMVLNLKTASALGLTIPQAVRLRADDVIR